MPHSAANVSRTASRAIELLDKDVDVAMQLMGVAMVAEPNDSLFRRRG
ncbi:hypothetical protein [Glutamicibacter arilaitensis]